MQEYRVWPDVGAAYLARLGKLAEVVGQEPRDESNDGAEGAELNLSKLHLGEEIRH